MTRPVLVTSVCSARGCDRVESNRDVARTLPVKIERIISADLWYIYVALAVFCLASNHE